MAAIMHEHVHFHRSAPRAARWAVALSALASGCLAPLEPAAQPELAAGAQALAAEADVDDTEVARAERDGLDHDAVGHIDARGVVFGKELVVHRRAQASGAASWTRRGVAPERKLSATLRDVVAAPAAVPGETMEVLIGIATDTKLPRLPSLEHGQPRSSPQNVAILAAREQDIRQAAATRRGERADFNARLAGLRGVIRDEYVVGNVVKVAMPATAIPELANDPDVLSVSLANERGQTQFVRWAEEALGTRVHRLFNYDGAMPNLYLGLFDTGVRETHAQFAANTGGGKIDYQLDCFYGTSSCVSSAGSTPFYDPHDPHGNHGTPSANVIMGGTANVLLRGISAVTLDSFNIWGHAEAFPGVGREALIRAFNRAVDVDDKIVSIPAGFSGDESSSDICVAAHDAFDSGMLVLAAVGNYEEVITEAPVAPAIARKALAIGAYDAYGDDVMYQVNGRVDGRIKPDLQFPTNVYSASNASDTALYPIFDGTSCATASSGGGAAIMYEVYNTLALGTEPGKLYAALLASSEGYSASDVNGAGRVRLQDVCGSWWAGTRTVSGSTNQDITIPVPASREDLHVAIWWPEEIGQAHKNVNLRIYPPGSGIAADTSLDATSVWEIAGVAGPVTAGNWTVRMDPSGTLPSSQVVHYAVQARCPHTNYFFDNFANLTKWTESGEGDWNTESLHSSWGYPLGGSGSPAAHSDDCDSECTLTSSTIDLTMAANVTLEFLRFVDSELDAGEYLRVEYFDGTSWISAFTFTNGSGDDDTWHQESVNLSHLAGRTDLRIRLKTKSSLTSEHVHIDDLRVRSGRP